VRTRPGIRVVRLLWIALGLVVGLVGCRPDDVRRPPLGDGAFAARCAKTEDCASGLCVRLDATGGICTKVCQSDQSCPPSDNWACVHSSATMLDVCACRRLADVEICNDGVDNDCNGKVDDCRVCNDRQVPATDPNNCGLCGNVCGIGKSCDGTGCVCPLAMPDDCGNCTNVANDPQNCGACAKVCTLGRTCAAGACTCPAGGPPDFCEGTGCVDRKTDRNNCGTCGKACAADQVCVDGGCVCPSGKITCDGACVDTQTSAQHCGGCGQACSAALACRAGQCGCTNFGLTVCGDQCADLLTDVRHCGACGQPCAAGERCVSGSCRCDSALVCGGTCVPVNDSTNCGACGTACPLGQYCSSTVCACQGAGLRPCGIACIDLNRDINNCGQCGRTCRIGESCSVGNCVCPSGQTYCDTAGRCATLSTDVANCGQCGRACRTGETCSAGNCVCPSGQTYCDTAGRCVSLSTDAGNCGQCSRACSPTQVCSASICRCPTTSQQFCAPDNVCVDILANTSHCGACGRACNPTEICQSGTCRCPTGTQIYCASQSACVDFYSNNQHCGACDRACPSGTTCSFGQCACNQSGFTLCGTSCYDLQTDATHCGSCTNDCPGNYACTAGQCKCPAPIVGTAVRVTNNVLDDIRVSAAWDGTHVGVAYVRVNSTTALNLRLALLNADGTLAADVSVADITGSLIGPELVWSGSEYALVWYNYDTGFKLVRLDAAGAAKGAPATITPSSTWDSPQSLDIAWSSSYGGYALAYRAGLNLVFRLLGADGTAPQAENSVMTSAVASQLQPVRLVVAPDGTWGMAYGGLSNASLAVFNADGSRTLAPQSLSNNSDYGSSRHPTLVHDGTTWVTAWVSATTPRAALVNRGQQANSPASLVSVASPNNVNEPVLAMVNGSLAVGWAQGGSSGSSYQFRLQRFAIPSTATSAMTPIHSAVDVLSTYNLNGLGNIALVATGANGLLGIWADDRWGTAREIYAAPINLMSCP
jgi:hypothetical protein